MARGTIDERVFLRDAHTTNLLWLTGYNGRLTENFNAYRCDTLKKDLIAT